MRNLFLAFAYQDESFARGLADDLAGRGLTLGSPVSLWPGMRLLPRIDSGLTQCRSALVVVSGDFLKFHWPVYELDGVASRDRVHSLLCGVAEEDVSGHSARLAVACIPSSMTEHLVRLLRHGLNGEDHSPG